MKNRMNLFRYQFVIALLFVVGSLSALGWSLVNAQEDNGHDERCDIVELTTHWVEHVVDLSSFAQTAQTDLDAALRELYIAGIAYQALAIQCGFDEVREAEMAHDTDHGLETLSDLDVEDEDGLVTMAFAMSIGDPENGQLLFNTLQSQTGFACATCHYVNSTERLVGPGLLGIGDPAHDPSEHSEGSMEGMNMEGMDNEPATDEDDDHADDEDNHEEENESASMDEVVEYIRVSILEPNEFIVEGFPENLMPAIYNEFLSEEEVNDLVAYLLTLR